jgi:hypothetical protein
MDQAEAPSVMRRGRWGQERRLEFIDSRLYWEGRLNRSGLTEFFGISVPQASLDLTEYQRLAPGNVVYDRTEKAYVATSTFKPILVDESSGRYLAELYALSTKTIPQDISFLGSIPPSDVVKHPTRQVEAALLRSVLHSIRTRTALEISYQTMTRPAPDRRVVSPHALAYDGFRWHIRAFCHMRNDFRDFVFARVLRYEPQVAPFAPPLQDEEWERMLEITIGPHPDLNEARRRAIALDYGMVDETLSISTRQSLTYYLLKRLGLDKSADQTAAHEQHIVLLNREELLPYLPKLQPK